MLNNLRTFGLSLFIVLAFIVIGIGFMFGLDNPVPWVMIAILIMLPFIHKRISARNFVSWNDSLSVGIESIDDDHKKLMNLINTLQTVVMYPTDEAFEREALAAVVDYTKYHFEREEGLLRDNGYPGYEAHKKVHEEMIAKVTNYIDEYENKRGEAICDLTKFLKTWLIKHIAGTDQEYSSYLVDKGVK